MDQSVRSAKAQTPWIGSRGRIGVIIPSTNIGVEYDCQQIIPPGVTWHFGRFFVEQPDLSSDDMFLAFIEAIRKTIPDAVRDIMTCEPTYIMMGMSAETFWGGLEGNAEFEARLREGIGPDKGLTSGAAALKAALDAFGAKTVAALTPYQPVGDEQVRRFLEESGYAVTKVIGLKCEIRHLDRAHAAARSHRCDPPRTRRRQRRCDRAGRNQPLDPEHLSRAGTTARQTADPDQHRDHLARVPFPWHQRQDIRQGMAA